MPSPEPPRTQLRPVRVGIKKLEGKNTNQCRARRQRQHAQNVQMGALRCTDRALQLGAIGFLKSHADISGTADLRRARHERASRQYYAHRGRAGFLHMSTNVLNATGAIKRLGRRQDANALASNWLSKSRALVCGDPSVRLWGGCVLICLSHLAQGGPCATSCRLS